MYKNILILGSRKSGKTTLSKMLGKELGFNIINLDGIMNAFESTFQRDDDSTYDDFKLNFVINYIKNELCSDVNILDGTRYVIEGNISNIERLLESIDLSKVLVVGLTYDEITKEEFFSAIRQTSSKFEPIYYFDDNMLLSEVSRYLLCNKNMSEQFEKYGVEKYDVSKGQESLNQIVEKLKERNNYLYSLNNKS